MNRDDIASYGWNAKDRSYGFSVRLPLPEATSDDSPTSRQLIAIKDFYQCDYPKISFDQASALLSYREYARLCGEIIFKNEPPSIVPALKTCLAAYIGHDHEMSKWVVNWNEKNYLRGTGSPRVKGSPFFADLELYGAHLIGMMKYQPEADEKENLQRLLKVNF